MYPMYITYYLVCRGVNTKFYTNYCGWVKECTVYVIQSNSYQNLYWNQDLGILNSIDDSLKRGISLFPDLQTALAVVNNFDESDRWCVLPYPNFKCILIGRKGER